MPSIFEQPQPPPRRNDALHADANTRVSAAEREDAFRKLNQMYSEGRLTPEEFSHRSSIVANANLRGEVREVFFDLPVGSIDDRLRLKAAAQSQQAANAARQASQLRDRTGIANRLLHELGLQTFELVTKRNYPRGVEILSMSYGIPGTHIIDPVRVRTGRIVTLTNKDYRSDGSTPNNPGRKHWALSGSGELISFTVASATFGVRGFGAPFPVSGPHNPFRGTWHKSSQKLNKAMRKSAERAGCVAAVADLQPIQAYGEPPKKNFGYDTGVDHFDAFYLDGSGRLVYGTPRHSVDAEEAMASALF